LRSNLIELDRNLGRERFTPRCSLALSSASGNREVAVKLSTSGEAPVARLIPIARRYEAVAIAGLSSQELTIVKRGLRRMYGNMKSRPASMSGPRTPARRQ